MSCLKFYRLLFALSITGVIFCLAATAQKTYADSAKYLSVPGPANQDTTKFATFYVMRPDNDIARTFWFGIYFDDTLMVRVDDAMRYIIKYAKTGNVKIWVKNPEQSLVTVNIEPGKKYYLQMITEPGGKTGSTKLVQLDEKEGEEVFNKMEYPPLYVYDPDPYTNSKYIWPSSPKTGYAHMKFSFPLSTRHYFAAPITGFMFSYYNKMVSLTFTEVETIHGDKRNFADKKDFEKYANRQIDNLKKDFKKSETLQILTQDSLTSDADYTSSIYVVTEDTKPYVFVNGSHPTLELREYNAWLYKKDLISGKGDVYSIYFSERGLPGELHTKEEIRFKIQQLLNSCEFGNFKE
jgi:hypothetical protein